MRRYLFITVALLASGGVATAQNQQEKPTTLRDIAEKAADELATTLELDDYQIFRVDSTFLHDYTAMSKELEQIKRSGATNHELYVRATDKWGNTIDSTFRCLFTEEQWTKYLKTDFGREKRSRDKRMAKREKEGK